MFLNKSKSKNNKSQEKLKHKGLAENLNLSFIFVKFRKKAAMSKLYLLRHGESFANKANLFSGWLDVGLTNKGVREAQKAGKLLSDVKFDEVYSSNLSRAYMTAMIILSENKNISFPVLDHKSDLEINKYSHSHNTTKSILTEIIKDERLNERFYGDLQGRTVEKSKKFIKDNDASLWSISFSNIDTAEKLEDTIKRTGSFYKEILVPKLRAGKNLLIVSHGTCIGTLLTHIKKINIEEMKKMELPNGKPMVFSFSKGVFKQLKV
jgi:2,3-bisphosphoglycerate-dependent phosphoglycerate mutase